MVLAYHLKLALFKSGFLGVTVLFCFIRIFNYRHTDFRSRRRRNNRFEELLAEAYQVSCSCSYVNGSCYNICQRSRKQDYFLQRAVRISWHLFWDLITGGRIFNKISYFEAAGVPSPFTHCWSLAIETQFYLIYPLILLGIYKLVKSRGEGRANRGLLFAGVTLLLALISVILMIVLFDPQQDASRVYYGTDTRAFSLLFGALLAILWEYRMVPRRLSASVNMAFGQCVILQCCS